MKKHKPKRIDSVLRKLARSWGQETEYLQAKIMNSWSEIAGQVIANHTKKIHFYDRKLFVNVDSSTVKNEMFLIRETIKKRVNKFAGYEMIDTVVILS